MRNLVGALLVAGVALGSAGCSGSSSGVAAGAPTVTRAAPSPSTTATGAAAGPTTPASPVPMPAGFKLIRGTAYQFGLPTGVKFVADNPAVSASGAIAGRWRYQVSPSGPFCVVVAVEQAGFTDQFPSSLIQSFTAEPQPDQKTQYNRVMTPAPAGTVGGVEQASTFTGTLPSGTSFTSQLYQRKYLTAGGTLVSLTVAGPQQHSAECRMPEIIRTFSATGLEFAGATPPATPAPAAS